MITFYNVCERSGCLLEKSLGYNDFIVDYTCFCRPIQNEVSIPRTGHRKFFLEQLDEVSDTFYESELYCIIEFCLSFMAAISGLTINKTEYAMIKGE